jgi:hypothetical protein
MSHVFSGDCPTRNLPVATKAIQRPGKILLTLEHERWRPFCPPLDLITSPGLLMAASEKLGARHLPRSNDLLMDRSHHTRDGRHAEICMDGVEG